MPTINLEMMKQLLQEFSEKETLTSEEINVIEQEITTLEQRVDFCRNRLKSLGADKEKLNGMKERYVSGIFPPPARVPFAGSVDEPLSHFTSSTPAPSPKHSSSTAVAVSKSQSDNIDIVEPEAVAQQAELVEPGTTSQHLDDHDGHNPVGQAQAAEESPNTDSQESSEPVKSINDALKGLFRK